MAGPLSPTTTFSKVKTPNDIQIPNSSVFENLGVGTRQGLQETTLAYAKEINLLQRAKNGQDDTIDFDEWNETNPYYREDIAWQEDLTWNIARNIQDELALQEEANAIGERATGLGKVARVGGMFAGAVLDPVNFIPFTFGAGKSLSVLARASRIGAANSLIEATTIAPLGLLAQEARGIEYGIDDVALNVAFAFGAGAGLSLLADGAKGAFRIARSAQIKTDPNIVKDMDELKSPLDDTKTTTDVDLVATKTLIGTQRIKGTADAADSNLLKNISLDNITDAIVVRTDGTVSTNIKDRGIRLLKDDNRLVVEGSSFDIVKVLPTLQSRISRDKFPQIELKFTDTLDDEIIAYERIAQRTKLLEQQTGRKAELSKTEVERTRVKVEEESFDIEVDEATGKIKSVFNVKNGRRTTKLPKKEADQKIRTLKDTVELKKREFNRDTQDLSVKNIDDQLIANRGGRASTDDLLKTKDAYRDKDIISAADESRGSLYNATAKDVNQMIVAVLSQPVFKKRHLQDLGIIFDKKNGTLRITDQNKANRDPLGRILVELKNKQDTLTKERSAVEELHTCLPIGS